MRLIELGSNINSFRTVKFNPTGLSIILGTHQQKVGTSTYNGIGKSLTLYLIHFCLGANSNKKLAEKLPDWTFYLKFSLDDKEYKVERNTKKQSVLFLNGKEYGLREFNEEMLTLAFNVDSELQKASFRSLISRFLRNRKEEYLNYSIFVFKEQEERALLSNAILLGLKADIVEKKFLLKEEYNHIDKLKKAISTDAIFQSVYGDIDEAELKIEELTESVSNLKANLESFQIAEDYKDVEVESNRLSYSLKQQVNEIGLIQETIKNIEKSLNLPIDMNKDLVSQLLKNVEIELGINVSERIDDVTNFHVNLTTGRATRLNQEKRELTRHIQVLKVNLEKTKIEYNNALKYLNEYGALDDYMSKNQKFIDDSSTLEKLKQSVELLDKYKKRIQEIKLVLAEDNLLTEEYLQDEKSNLLKTLMDGFRELTGKFYDDKKGAISVKNNEGDNKLRYNIDVHIQDDASDGINEVRIFCFDILLLMLQKHHSIKFLFHDSRLFANMDTHQRFTALSIANSLESSGFQYIMSMNQDTLDVLKQERTSEEIKELITDKVVLELSGKTPEERLLGIHLDLKYES